MEKERTKEKNKDLPVDLVILTFVAINIGLILLDFYSHPDNYLADQQRRVILQKYIGDLAKFIGNYGLNSCSAMAVTFLKHFANLFSDSLNYHKFTSNAFKIGIGSIIAIGVAVETFANNNHLVGDTSLGIAGALVGAFSTDLLIKRMREKMSKSS